MIKLHLFLHSLLLLLSVVSTKLSGQTLTVSNPSLLSQTINANRSSETIEAGDDFSKTYESGQFFFDQMNYSTFFINWFVAAEWKVSATKIETNWHPDLKLKIRVIDAGVPNFTFFGDRVDTANGTVVELINNLQDYDIITGAGNVRDAGLNYEVEVPSVTIPAGNYQSQVTFTIYAN